MGIVNYTYNRSTSGGEIITHLINATDAAGLHFDGAAGSVAFTPTDVGTKNSFEFIVQASEWPTSGEQYIVDYGPYSSGRFYISNAAGDLKIKFNTEVSPAFSGFKLDDLKPHHLVVTANDLVVTVYVDGNNIGTHTFSVASQIDACTVAAFGSHSGGASIEWFNGTLYRARVWNKTLTQPEVTASYENATVPFADQYGVEPAQNVSTCVQDGSDPYTSFTSVSATGFTAIQTGTVVSIAGTADEIALVQGKNYRVSFYIANTSQAPRVSFAESLTGSVLQELVGLGVMTTGTQTFDVTYTGAAATGVLKFDNTAVASYAMTLLSITRVGVVSDYDLAFANPSPSPNGQSLMVRDRASAADGTSSATGVVQVTPIEQLNAKAARIGTTTATPADGDLLVSGNAGIGTANVNRTSNTVALTIGNGTADNYRSALELVGSEVTADDAVGSIAFWNVGGSGGAIATIVGNRSGADNSGALLFQTKNAGSNDTRLTIDSAGNVGIGDTGPNRNLCVKAAAASDGNISLKINDGTEWIFSHKVADGDLHIANNAGTSIVELSQAGLATFSAGINLGNVASATATTLDGYEEGTWTASLSGTTETLGNATGKYVRIGSLVWVSWYSDSTTLASSSGNAFISGLPFDAPDSAQNYTVFSYTFGNAVTGNSSGGYVNPNTDKMYFIDDATLTKPTFIDGSGKFIMVTAVYETDADFN